MRRLLWSPGDLASDYERAVAAGAVVVMPSDPKPWGQTVAHVRDNNRFLVELCTPPMSGKFGTTGNPSF